MASGKKLAGTTPFHPSAQRTVDGASAGIENAVSYDDGLLFINLTAITAGDVQFTYEVSPDGGTTWFPLERTALLVAAQAVTLSVRAPIGRLWRLQWNLTTGPITFTAWAEFSNRA